ncbi:zinc-dependent alcohol dehydrogenase family protein [Permianibacter aggregans]|uniref:NADPH:quinone reductase-like Zn-dependent oxidoreductase n=1 Tax=Permianibacter aggregans TaxID=1510150 RepID=A0A4R6UGP1_9GAMM|nr:NAD(P)-dependent alcohol dehydrogenase [Permianibacter aggregans]QGX39613.1 NAD(P)-dependent alcohol dehydrogenase [Permianibacter aggregans]TDQ45482.1 NADPH:quinone reductase-like Zn-dependent oxidoreductase [Permianibacter aggregans]
MKAVQLFGHRLDLLRAITQPIPEPKGNEVLVHLRATSLNYRDFALATGRYQTHLPLPFVPLSDGAGVVVAAGPQVREWRPGDRVIGHYTTAWQNGRFDERYHQSKLGGPLDGLLQEFRVLPETALVKTPEHLSDREAATLPVAALTAWNALQDLALPTGAWLLVQGSGSVSLFALQFARAQGLQVIATTTSENKMAILRELGAHEVLLTRDRPEWGKQVYQSADDRGVDGVVDVGGNVTLAQSLAALRGGGAIAMVGFLGGFDAAPDLTLPMLVKRARLLGQSVGSREHFQMMNRAISAQQIRPVIDRTFAFHEYRNAWEHVGSGSAVGKTVIDMAA